MNRCNRRKNKNALQKEALLSLKEHYDMDEMSNFNPDEHFIKLLLRVRISDRRMVMIVF